MTLSSRQINELLSANGLHPSRALGQNFVGDPNTVRRIARLAEIDPGQRVVEIGAGLGSLTLALAEAGALVRAVEIDQRLVPILRSIVEPIGVEVHQADALTIDWTELLGENSGALGTRVRVAPEGESGYRCAEVPEESKPTPSTPWVLVANLPYNVAVPVIIRVLELAPMIDRMLVMVQREVAERLVAGSGDPAYGAVSVKVAYFADASIVGRVPPSVFVPRPNVESALVRVVRTPGVAVSTEIVPYDRLFELVRAGFAHRRKMLRRSLAGLLTAEQFAKADVDSSSRAEDLGVLDWGRLAATREVGSLEVAIVEQEATK